MLCMNIHGSSYDAFRICKGQNLKVNLSNSKSRTQVRYCSNSCAAEIDDNRQNPVRILPLPNHVKTITSSSNPFVKHCVKLRQSSSYRHSHGSVLLVGSTPIRSWKAFFLLLLFPLDYFCSLVVYSNEFSVLYSFFGQYMYIYILISMWEISVCIYAYVNQWTRVM